MKLPPLFQDISLANWGLIAWLQGTRRSLPLKGVEARFSVRGRLASVEIDQIYHQDGNEVLDCTYTFPLPHGAAIHQCEFHVNGRVIVAKVEELEAARKIYAEKSVAGHRATLVDSVRDNLFELTLGNLAPGDTLIVRLAYFQPLEPTGGSYELRVPFCPGIRYIPGRPLLRQNSGRGVEDDTSQTPDASRLSPPRIDSLHPDAAYISVEGLLFNCGPTVHSPSHTLVLRTGENCTEVSLGDRGAVPDRDLVVHFEPAPSATLQHEGWTYQNDGHTYGLLAFQAPVHVESSASTWAQDIYFLVDRSGSMHGQKWLATAHAFREFLGHLAPQDRAWVTFFESDYQDLAEKPLPPGALLAEPIVQRLEHWETGGGTELLPAARHVLERCLAHSHGRNIAVVIITDGQVGNEAEIQRLFRDHSEIRVHTFGIDTCVNDSFLQALARQQRGTCRLADPRDDLAGLISQLGARMRQPVLTDLQITTPGWEWPGESPSDIFVGDSLTLSVRGPSEATELTLRGRIPSGGQMEMPITILPTNDVAICRLWQQKQISHFLTNGQVAQAVHLAKLANLLCSGTAFIAWDEQEKVAVVGKHHVYQPSLQPDLWGDSDMGAVFASPPCASILCRPASPNDLCMEAPASPPHYSQRRLERTQKSRPMSLRTKSSSTADQTFAPPRAAANQPAPQIKVLVAAESAAPWRHQLVSAWSRLQRADAVAWLDWLEQWTLANPSARKELEATLEALAAQLLVMTSDAQKAAACHQWASSTLGPWPAFLQPILAWLENC